MTARISLAPLALAGGAVVVAAAVTWWWLTFGDVVTYGYLAWTDAGRCLASDSDLCSLAKTLCLAAHPRHIAPYSSGAFWFGLAALSAGLLASRRTLPPSSLSRS